MVKFSSFVMRCKFECLYLRLKTLKLNSPAVVVVVGSCVVVVVTCSVVVVVGSRIDYCKFDNEQLCINA